jgi:Xaa-Pro aminopeptidase
MREVKAMNKESFIANRQAFIDKMTAPSFALFFSGSAPEKSNDQRYPFICDRNFYYLTGIMRENFTLLLVKGAKLERSFLFIEEPSDYATKWLGKRMTASEAAELSGIAETDIKLNQEFDDYLHQAVLSDSRRALIELPSFLYLDLYRAKPYKVAKSLEVTANLRKAYPEIVVRNANDIAYWLRSIKSDREVRMIEQAIAYTKIGIEAIMANAKAGVNERQLDALFDFTIRVNGSDGTAFNTIVASGKNATILHYEQNDRNIKDNDLVLIDLGALSGPYAADITRTFPVNGKFTERQKEIYSLVLDVNKKTIAMVKPGLTVPELNKFASDELAKGLLKLGLIKDVSEIGKYYYHTVSHYLGLDVHDVGTYQRPLEAGMVITVEPGIYIEDEGIGIRIEDDVLVTEKGHRNLSETIVKEIAAIEELMALNP